MCESSECLNFKEIYYSNRHISIHSLKTVPLPSGTLIATFLSFLRQLQKSFIGVFSCTALATLMS